MKKIMNKIGPSRRHRCPGSLAEVKDRVSVVPENVIVIVIVPLLEYSEKNLVPSHRGDQSYLNPLPASPGARSPR